MIQFTQRIAAGLLSASIFAHAAAGQTPPDDLGLEHGAQMQRDVSNFIDFMLDRYYPVYEASSKAYAPEDDKDRAKERLKFSMFKNLLDGCYGQPTITDVAWAANQMLTHNWTGLEEADMKRMTEPQDAKKLYSDFLDAKHNAARWVWELNDAFFKAHPEAADRIDDLREHGYGGDLYAKSDKAGLMLIDEYMAPMVFGPYSLFLADPAYAARINLMNSAPPEFYGEVREVFEETSGSADFEPRPYKAFNHNLPCRTPG